MDDVFFYFMFVLDCFFVELFSHFCESSEFEQFYFVIVFEVVELVGCSVDASQ